MTYARTYLRTKLNSLGYKEWCDGFNFENIPLTLLNKSYHIDSQSGSGEKINQYDLEHLQVMRIRFFLKGYKNPAAAIDEALAEIKKILQAVLNPNARLTHQEIKNIFYRNYTIEQFDESNDNSLITTIEFEFKSILNIGG